MYFIASISILIAAHAYGLWRVRRVHPILNPLAWILTYSLVKSVPYAFLSYFYPEVVDSRVALYVGYSDLPDLIAFFCLLYALFISSLVMGYELLGGPSAQAVYVTWAKSWATGFVPRKSIQIALIAMAVIFFALKLKAIGGLSGSLLGGNLDRGAASTGLGYVLSVADITVALAVIYSLIRYKVSHSYADMIVFIAVLVFALLSFSLLGGRKTFLQLMLIMLAFWKLFGGRFEVLSIKSLSVALIAVVYFLVVLDVRLSVYERDLLFQYSSFGYLSGFVTFLSNLSYNDTYYFIINYFSSHDSFYGKTFVDLMWAPIPSAIYPEKPPIDEGFYVKSLIDGAYRIPPTPAKEFIGFGSWPPETFGNFIMNFGIFSVIIGGVALAFFYLLIIKKAMQMKGFEIVSVFVVYQSTLNFHISNLRIVNLLTTILFGVVVWYAAKAVGMLLRGEKYGAAINVHR